MPVTLNSRIKRKIENYISPMLSKGLLKLKYPDSKNNPKQAYIKTPYPFRGVKNDKSDYKNKRNDISRRQLK
jgi:hypothetical protein